MSDAPARQPFHPNGPDAAGVISWVHIGDLHMTRAEEQNQRDLAAIVEEINVAFARSIAFVYLPGDVADHGSSAEYAVVRESLDKLAVPWCAIVGDHDVHEKSFANFLHFMAGQTRYSFQVGGIHFFALNAFDIPDPGSFTLLPEQLDWLEQKLHSLPQRDSAVLLLHCYPSDLKHGGERLRTLVASPAVRLLDMGHTHYNELANDGRTLYTATRSTGQIEEGPVGFSVTNIDGAVISWKFLPLGDLPAVMITSPADARFITDATLAEHVVSGTLRIRAKAWSPGLIVSAVATFAGDVVSLTQIPGSQVWIAELPLAGVADGVHTLSVKVLDQAGRSASDEIRLVAGESAYLAPSRAARDQDNAVAAWPERGLLGTQLGPNKNGRKW